MIVRRPYQGLHRKLVIAFDIGTTYSGVSYSILTPEEVPSILGVYRFPGQEATAGDSKIPSILYYNERGDVCAIGAEATLPGTVRQAEDEEWTKVEWFKLHLRPISKSTTSQEGGNDHVHISPLPRHKTITDVFSDYLRYLYRCTRTYIEETHARGAELWKSVEGRVDFIMSHPNSWGGPQQTQLRRATVQAELIPDTPDGHSRVQFVTEGEASAHYCMTSGFTADAIKDGTSLMVVDTGGGTVDISAYTVKKTENMPLVMEEIAPAECIFQGSMMVSFRVRDFLKQKLRGSNFCNDEDIEEMFQQFDKSAKPTFSNPDTPSYIKFGSLRDKHPLFGIRNGQLTLSGEEMKDLFAPSISAITEVVNRQLYAARAPISTVFLVGGFAASPWLFSQLDAVSRDLCLRLTRPDTHTGKVVANGSVSFYLDHFVSVRVARFTYGSVIGVDHDPSDPEHVRRSREIITMPSGRTVIGGYFLILIKRGIQVSEEKEFYYELQCESYDPFDSNRVSARVVAYKGNFQNPRWTDSDPGMFTTLCTVQGDTSHVHRSPLRGPKDLYHYYVQKHKIILLFGLTELKAQLSWVENGVERRSPIETVYDEIH